MKKRHLNFLSVNCLQSVVIPILFFYYSLIYFCYLNLNYSTSVVMATFLEEESSDLGNKRLTKKSVSFVDDDIVKPKPPSRLDIMKSELERMRRRDEEIDRREKEHRRLVKF